MHLYFKNTRDGTLPSGTPKLKSEWDYYGYNDIPSMWNLKRKDTKALTKRKEARGLGKRTYGC